MSALAFLLAPSLVAGWQSTTVTTTLDYKQGDAPLQGTLVAPRGASKAPAVLIIHDWDGPTSYETTRATMLAQLGYVALSADIYGKDVRPKSMEENRTQATKYYNDPALFRARLQAGLDALKARPEVDPNRVVAIGYCFGGSGVLELARSGADLKGVASFHGGLRTTMPFSADKTKAKVIVFHAAQDPSVPREQFNGFLEEVRDAKVDYQMVIYNLNVHAFTVIGGSQYNADADRRSWSSLQNFLTETIGK